MHPLQKLKSIGPKKIPKIGIAINTGRPEMYFNLRTKDFLANELLNTTISLIFILFTALKEIIENNEIAGKTISIKKNELSGKLVLLALAHNNSVKKSPLPSKTIVLGNRKPNSGGINRVPPKITSTYCLQRTKTFL